jgi:hypothetical protein
MIENDKIHYFRILTYNNVHVHALKWPDENVITKHQGKQFFKSLLRV